MVIQSNCRTGVDAARRFAVVVVSLVSLSACNGDDADRIDELRGEVARLESQLEDVRSTVAEAEAAVDTLKGAVDDLLSAMNEFSHSNWRTAVISVSAAASEVEDAAVLVESAVDDAVRAVN